MEMDFNKYTKIEDLSIIQKLLRDTMQELHEICETHGLTYNLFAGSLLGAVRHQDIIPWDDDIDITMPRPDYEKLIDIVEKEYSDKYTLYHYPMDNYCYPFGKFCRNDTILIEKPVRKKLSKIALYIDIFPLDGVPELTEKELKKRYQCAARYKRFLNISAGKVAASPVWWKKPYIIVHWLKRLPFSILGYKYFLKKIDQITKLNAFEECDKVSFVSPWSYGMKGIVNKKEYFDRKLYKFGEYAFWGMAEYDVHLQKVYGDYMTPPPVSQRVATHNYDLYLENK